MTEIIETSRPPFRRHMIDPVAFFAALILGPLLVTAMTFWLMLIPVGALIVGGPVYLVLGTPVLLWWLSGHEPDSGTIAILGVGTVFVTAVPFTLFLSLTVPHVELGVGLMTLGLAALFAAIWGAAFASLYRRFRRDFFTRTA